MTDEEHYKQDAIRIATDPERFIASAKAHRLLAYIEWLRIMGLMETGDLTGD